MKKEFGEEVNLIAGGGGIFDVTVDGRMVFSKFKTGRFPEPNEIIDKLK